MRRAGLVLACCFAVAGSARGGDLTPPPGPITPTGSTIQSIMSAVDAVIADAEATGSALKSADIPTPIESLPGASDADFVISEPGRYMLTDNWFGDGANDCIRIEASDVVIDLRGFFIDGTPSGGGWAITTIGGVNGVRIVNGTILQYDNGIRLTGENNVVEDVRFMEIFAGNALQVGGNSRVARCLAYDTAGGYLIGDGSFVTDCISTTCYATSFSVGVGTTVLNCAASGTITGFVGSEGAVFRGCTATNLTTGYEAYGCVLIGCAVINAIGDGFVTQRSHLRGCQATDSGGHGFWLQAGNHVVRCTSIGNAGAGFQVNGVRNRLTSNMAAANFTSGYSVTTAASDSILTGNFSEGTISAYAIQNAGILMFGPIRTSLTGAGPHDNFSQ